MALTHLVDSSVLTRLRQTAVREAIQPWAERSELARTGISDLEIGYSARNAGEWDRLAEALDAFELVETTAEHTCAPLDRFSDYSQQSTTEDERCPTC